MNKSIISKKGILLTLKIIIVAAALGIFQSVKEASNLDFQLLYKASATTVTCPFTQCGGGGFECKGTTTCWDDFSGINRECYAEACCNGGGGTVTCTSTDGRSDGKCYMNCGGGTPPNPGPPKFRVMGSVINPDNFSVHVRPDEVEYEVNFEPGGEPFWYGTHEGGTPFFRDDDQFEEGDQVIIELLNREPGTTCTWEHKKVSPLNNYDGPIITSGDGCKATITIQGNCTVPGQLDNVDSCNRVNFLLEGGNDTSECGENGENCICEFGKYVVAINKTAFDDTSQQMSCSLDYTTRNSEGNLLEIVDSFKNAWEVEGGRDTTDLVVNPSNAPTINPGWELNWNTEYCWNVQAQYTSNVGIEAPAPFTFHTNRTPQFIRMGGQVNETPINNADGIETANINTGIFSCQHTSADCLATTNGNDFGGDNCSVGIPGEANTDSTLHLWFEYKDLDNTETVNENSVHKLAFVKKGTFNNEVNVPADAVGDNATFLATLRFKDGNNHLENGEIPVILEGVSADDIVITASKWEDPQKRIRIVYTLNFLNSFPSDKYNIYGMFESEVNDPRTGFTGQSLADNMPDTAASNWANHYFTLRGSWNVDMTKPSAAINIAPFGVDRFNIVWTASDSTGIPRNSAQLKCYSTNGALREITYTGPSRQRGESFNIPLYTNPVGLEQMESCVTNEDISNFTRPRSSNRYSLTTSYSMDDYRLYPYFNALIHVEDAACNPDEETTGGTNVNDSWIATRQGSYYSDSGFDYESPNQLANEQPINLFTANSGGLIRFMGTFRDGEYNLEAGSTNFIATDNQPMDPNIKSLTEQHSKNYKDENTKPRQPLEPDQDWADYLEALIIRNGIDPSQPSNQASGGTKTGTTFTNAFGNCSGDGTCVKWITGDLTLNAMQCNSNYILIVNGNVTVNEILTSVENENDSASCLFLIHGDLAFNSADIKDNVNHQYDHDNNPATPTLKVNTSPYDVFAGFFVLAEEGRVTITENSSQLTPRLADAFYLRGGLIARDISSQRNLGLRNNMQPPQLIVYDPKYIYAFKDVLGENLINVRERGYQE